MTLSVELLLSMCLAIALAILVTIWILEAKHIDSFKCRCVKLFTYAALIAIDVGLLTVHCLTGEKYGLDLLCIFLWLTCIVLSALNMRN